MKATGRAVLSPVVLKKSRCGMRLSLLRSIGEKREKDFHKLGIYEAEDLVRFYPRAYLDLTERASIRNAYHNDVILIACEVTRLAPVNFSSPRKMVRAFCTQDEIGRAHV